MKNIALVLDNKSRDIDGVALISKYLMDFGYTVSIVPFNLMQFELYLNKFDFILFNFIRNYNINLILDIASSNIPVGICDTEGGVFSNIKIFYDQLPANIIKIDNLHYFFWGPVLANYAKENNILRSDQIYITGCPRYDVYSDFGRKYGKVSLTEKGYILINTNFPLANPKFNTPQLEIEQAKVSLNQFNRIKSLRQDQIQERNAFVELVDFLLKNTEIDIVIRPHPFESSEFYELKYIFNNRIKINKKGTVKSIIQNSIAVIQRGCSTGLETRLLGKKSLSPNWPPFKNTTMVDEGNLFFNSKEEMLRYLIKDVHKNYELNLGIETQKQIENFFYKNDGKSSLRVAELIDKIVKKNQSKKYSKFIIKSYIKRIIFNAGIFDKFLFLKLYNNEIKKWHRSEKYFNINDIQRCLNYLGFNYIIGSIDRKYSFRKTKTVNIKRIK